MTGDATSGNSAVPPPLPPPPLADVRVVPARTPRAGELAPAWRLITSLTWIAVAVALAAVWKTSDQLGLSTWWLGPRGEPQPRVVQLLPFVVPLLMVLAAVNNARRLPQLGLLGSAGIVAIGIGDLSTFSRLALIELAIGVAAALVSLASTTGQYRSRGADDRGR